MCSRRASIASRSSAVPGTAAAIGANALTPAVTLRSANMPNETAPKTSRIVQMNDVGPSTATEATPDDHVAAAGPVQQGDDQRDDHGDEGDQELGRPAQVTRDDGLGQDPDAGGGEDDDERQQQRVADRRCGDGAH